jgi:hypothetical protein
MYYLHYIRCLSCLGEKQRRKNHPNVHVKIVPTVVIAVVAMVVIAAVNVLTVVIAKHVLDVKTVS